MTRLTEPGTAEATTRVGVMGGTFDPIHNGHLAAASEVASKLSLDLVVFVPSGHSWQKRERAVSSGEHRYLMTVLATAADPRFRVSRTDLDRPGPTYTVDTLAALQQQFGSRTQLFLIFGTDLIEQLPTWHEPAKVAAAARLVAVARPGYPAVTPGCEIVSVPGIEVSSSDCRARVGRGEPVAYLLPALVEQYIANNGLYRTAG